MLYRKEGTLRGEQVCLVMGIMLQKWGQNAFLLLS